jgi:hypothetical protein
VLTTVRFRPTTVHAGRTPISPEHAGALSRGHAPVMLRPSSRWSVAVERLSANQAGHIPSWRGLYERYALSPVADACRWLPLLLSPLLSVAVRVTTRTVQGMARARSGQAPAWPLSSDRSARRDSGIKRDFA